MAKMDVKRNQDAKSIAELHGVDEKTVRNWVPDGCPHTRRKNRLFFDAAEVARWLEENNRNAKPGRPPQIDPGDYDSLGGDKKWWDAVNAKLKALRTQGELVATALVDKFFGDVIGIARQKFMNLGVRLSPILEGKDGAERQVTIDAAVSEILNELAVTPVPLPDKLEATAKVKAVRVGRKKHPSGRRRRAGAAKPKSNAVRSRNN